MALLQHPCKWDVVPSEPPRDMLLYSQIWTSGKKCFCIVRGRLWHDFASLTPSSDHREVEDSLPGRHVTELPALAAHEPHAG